MGALANMFRDRVAVVAGVANRHSIAYALARDLKKLGARLVLATHPAQAVQKRVERILPELEPVAHIPADISCDAGLNSIARVVAEHTERVDFVVHSVAFSDREELTGDYQRLSRANFDQTMATSVYSLTGLCRELGPLLGEGASVVTMTYLGSSLYVPNYNVMGVAKAALEASVRYLAVDLGRHGVRINAISAGPIKTLAASGIGDFSRMLEWSRLNTPLRSNVRADDVAKVGLYLLSPMAAAVSGETHFVDSGAQASGMAMA